MTPKESALQMLEHSLVVQNNHCWEDFCELDESLTKRERDKIHLLLSEKFSEYAKQGIYLSSSFLVNQIYLFCHLQIDVKTFDSFIQAKISTLGLDEPSLLIIPLHSFAFKQSFKFREKHAHFDIISGNEYWVFEKVKSKKKLTGILREVCKKWSLKNVSIENELSNYLNSYTTAYDWLLNSPLLLIRERVHQIEPLEGIYAWNRRLNFATAKLYARSVLENEQRLGDDCSNWNLHHMLHLSKQVDGLYHLQSIPQLPKYSLVMKWTNLNIVLDPKKNKCRKLLLIENAIDDLFQRKCLDDVAYWKSEKRTPKIQKFADALYFFCKSFKSEDDVDKIIFLQTAFETMLIDGLCMNKRETILDRASFLLGQSNQMIESLEQLILSRNGIIHAGKIPDLEKKHIQACKHLFLLLFEKMECNLDALDNTSEFLTHYFKHFSGKTIIREIVESVTKKILSLIHK